MNEGKGLLEKSFLYTLFFQKCEISPFFLNDPFLTHKVVCLTYGQVTGWHVVGLRVLSHAGEMLTEETKSVVVIPGQLTCQLLQTTHSFSLITCKQIY